MATEPTEVVNGPTPASDQPGSQDASSADARQPAESGASPTSEQAEERRAGLSQFFSRLIRGEDRGESRTVSDGQAEESAPAQDDGQQATAEADDQPQATQPEIIQASPEELARLVQSEVDKEIHRREQISRQRQTEAQRRQAEQQIEQELREDPIGAAQKILEQREQARTAEQEVHKSLQAVTTSVQGVTQEFDNVILAPLYHAIPQDKRDEVFGNGPVGIDGRREYVQKALKTIQAHYENVGIQKGQQQFRQRLQSDQSFRKQLYHEFRGITEEPLVAPAAAATGNGRSHDDPLRQLLSSSNDQGVNF